MSGLPLAESEALAVALMHAVAATVLVAIAENVALGEYNDVTVELGDGRAVPLPKLPLARPEPEMEGLGEVDALARAVAESSDVKDDSREGVADAEEGALAVLDWVDTAEPVAREEVLSVCVGEGGDEKVRLSKLSLLDGERVGDGCGVTVGGGDREADGSAEVVGGSEAELLRVPPPHTVALGNGVVEEL